LFNDQKLLVITTGEDHYVRFWDTSFNLISEYNMSKEFPEISYATGGRTKDISIQSLDIYACQPPPTLNIDNIETTGYEKDGAKLLIATRNGAVIEISLGTKLEGLQATPGEIGMDIEKPGEIYEKKETYQQLKNLQFHPNTVLSSHASQVISGAGRAAEDILYQRKLRFALHPIKPLMVTVGYDHDLIFWNTVTNTSIYSGTLEQPPSCLRFSPDGKYLVTGFETGLVQICTIGEEPNKKSKKGRGELPDHRGRKDDDKKDEKKNMADKDGLSAIIYKVEQAIQEPNWNVLNIVFSKRGKYMAISYLNKKEPEDGEEKVTGIVNIYKLSEAEQGKKDIKEKLYQKWQVVKSTACSNLVPAVFHGCYFMFFSKDDRYLFLNFQQFDKYNLRENDDKERNYLVWDLEHDQKQDNIEMINDTEIGVLLFPNHVNGIYRYHEKYLEKQKQVESGAIVKNPIVSSMQSLPFDEGDEEFLVLGTTRGDINLVNKACLFVGQAQSVEALRGDQYCLAKSYSAHCSPVDNLEFSSLKGNKLFTSGEGDEVIFEWTVNRGEKSWELDHTDYRMEMEDMFLREVEKKSEYKKIIAEMLESRNQIIELQQNIDTSVEPEISLKLEKIIGRKAFNRRNNVYYTANNHLLFSAASMLVMINIPPEGLDITEESKQIFFKEKFLEIDGGDAESTSPEVSTFTLSPDRRYVCVGTLQKKAKLVTWELTTNTFVKEWTLENCAVIMNIKYSGDKKRLACIALTESYSQVVMLIDNNTGEILGSTEFTYSVPFRIKEIDFLPKSNEEFVTLGLQHLSHWKLKGGLLIFEELPIENPREMMKKAGIQRIEHERNRRKEKNKNAIEMKDGEEVFPLEVTFMAIIFLFDELMITGGDDGYVRTVY
jgi:WD40 repeat protein